MKIKIENYENMTPEEKIAALEAYDPEKDGFVAKKTFDDAASDLAKYKKQLREKQTEEEAKAEKDREERERMIARIEELEREKKHGTFVNAYLGVGYDEKLARSSADALIKGDFDTVFANQKAHIAGEIEKLRSEKLDTTPAPGGNGSGGGMTIEQLRAMSPKERYDFAQNNPEEYKTLYGGN